MSHLFFKAFKPTPDNKVKELILEAELASVEHRAASEHHGALADMYEKRLDRLRNQLTQGARQ